MTGIFYRIENYKPDRRRYGGTVSQFDFDGHITLKDAASKVASDFSFDRQCIRSNIYKYKNNRDLKDVDYRKSFPEGDEQDV